MAPLISTLLTAGPALIRLFGKSKGGNIERTTETISAVLDTIQGKPSPEQVNRLQAVVDSLPQDEVAELKVSLEKIAAEREKNHLDYDLAMHTEQQKTIRSADPKYVRPKTANRHSYFSMLYVCAFEIAEALGYGSGASMELAMLIASPTLAYFGFRTFDKFSKHGASN